MVKYKYDAFGNCKIINSNDNDLAKNNPIRYRGYYYDIDTGLYYLNSRYYNPLWRRFISPASTKSLDSEAINGLNLYSFASNNPVKKPKFAANQSKNTNEFSNFSVNVDFSMPIFITKNSNYWNPHWENDWFDPDLPGFFRLSSAGYEIINWGLSMYKGTLYFDNNEHYSIYISSGNVGIYAGVNYKEGIGFDASANVAEIGYDGRAIDASLEGLSVGFTYMYKDAKFEMKHGYGWWGWSVSIDFIELFKLLFGG